MSRPARALIDLSALRQNYSSARLRHGGRVLAVLKANAYGHGAVRCAEALASCADGFAVAFLDEALVLREAGLQAPILVLEGAFSMRELEAMCVHGLWTVVHHADQVRMIEQASAGVHGLNIWLKLDSGMRRAGLAPESFRNAHSRLASCERVSRISLMSHFACADEVDAEFTREQMAVFDAATAGLGGERSISNSAGTLAWPQANRNWARIGILLYGANPVPGNQERLQPVMRLQSEVFAERILEPGDSLGYGATFRAEKRMRVGLVAIGYADGYPRGAGTGTPVAIGGQISRILGRVSMDMATVDLSELPREGIGSMVELWGEQVSVNEVAQQAGTISYELLCNVKRVPLVYSGAAAR